MWPNWSAALACGKQTAPEVFGINLLHGRKLPLVCLPTTAGTGAEVSPNAILLDETDELKKGVVSPHLVPDAAFVDPLLTISVPPAVTAATGLDALTHCIEAYANKFAHPIVDTYALQGIKLISANLARAVRNGQTSKPAPRWRSGVFTADFASVRSTRPRFMRWPIRSAEDSHRARRLERAAAAARAAFQFFRRAGALREIAAALGVARNGSALTTAEHGVEFLSQTVPRLWRAAKAFRIEHPARRDSVLAKARRCR
jgi:hypothetical protein